MRTRRALAVLAGGIALLVAVPAVAQHMAYVGPGSPDLSTKTAEDGQHAGVIRAGFASCVYKHSRRKVDALLKSSDPVSIDFSRLGLTAPTMMTALDMPTCMGPYARANDAMVQFRMDQRSLRAMLVETAYLARYPAAPGLLDAMPAVDRRYVSTDAALVAARASADFADCLVRVAPHESDAFLRTTSGSAAETVAVNRLAVAIPRCVSAGQTVKLNKMALREFVADGLWTASVSVPEKK